MVHLKSLKSFQNQKDLENFSKITSRQPNSTLIKTKQAGTELGQAQLKLGLDFTLINI